MPDETPAVWRSGWFHTLSRFIALIVVFVLFAFIVDEWAFLTPANLEGILRDSAVYATAALGMTLVIITAGIDLSVGSMIALTVVTVAWVLNLNYTATPVEGGEPATVYLVYQFPVLLPILAVIAAMFAATLAGLCNGATIVGLRLVPFIVTLGTMGIFRGLAKGIAEVGSGAKNISPPEGTWISHILDPTLTTWLGWLSGKPGVSPQGLDWFILPLGVWILIFASVAAALVLRYTRLGRHIYAVGSNAETARLCGVPVGRTKIVVYALCGLFAGLAGLMQFCREVGQGNPTTAVSYELYVIAAVVIGGGSLMGGEGSILGSVIGALIIAILRNGGESMGWYQWVQEIVIGVIIIAAVALDQLRHRWLQ
jgi:ribose transport system permease protein/erythritol transport system permease protein